MSEIKTTENVVLSIKPGTSSVSVPKALLTVPALLDKAESTIAKVTDGLIKQVDQLKSAVATESDRLIQLNEEITLKTEYSKQLDAEYERKKAEHEYEFQLYKRNTKSEFEQEHTQHKRDTLDLLAGEFEYDLVKPDYHKSLKDAAESEKKRADTKIATVTASVKREHDLKLRESEAGSKLAISKLEAQLEAAKDKIIFLESRNAELVKEVDKAGERIVKVAEAKATAAEVNISK